MRIRHATEADISACAELGRALCTESPTFSRLGFDSRSVTTLAFYILDNPDEHCWFVAEDDTGEIVGMMGGYIASNPYSTTRVASDYLLYVTPSKRGAITAKRLISAFEEWASEQGVRHIQPGVMANPSNARAGALYERLGYAPVGRVYMKEI